MDGKRQDLTSDNNIISAQSGAYIRLIHCLGSPKGLLNLKDCKTGFHDR